MTVLWVDFWRQAVRAGREHQRDGAEEEAEALGEAGGGGGEALQVFAAELSRAGPGRFNQTGRGASCAKLRVRS